MPLSAPSYDVDYHKKIELEETPQAARLAEWIVSRLPILRVTDFGCSTGIYVRAFNERGIHAIGIESSEDAVAHRLCENVKLGDITAHCEIGWACEMGLCIEVAEHIPEEQADDLIRCLVRHCRKWLVFSAAIPGQGGLGHINCQHKPYWIEKFERRGWVVDYVQTQGLLNYMRQGAHMGWFIQNAMVLRPLRRA